MSESIKYLLEESRMPRSFDEAVRCKHEGVSKAILFNLAMALAGLPSVPESA
jgi:hypothetical protein